MLPLPIACILVIYAVLAVIDWRMSVKAIRAGRAEERNPLMRGVLNLAGPWLGLAVKLAHVGFTVWAVHWLWVRGGIDFAWGIALMVLVGQSAIVIYNLMQLRQ